MLFSHLGRPSQAIIKVVLWGHPVFLQHVTVNRNRNDTHSPWVCTIRTLQSLKRRKTEGATGPVSTGCQTKYRLFPLANHKGTLTFIFLINKVCIYSNHVFTLNSLSSPSTGKTVPMTERLTMIQMGENNALRRSWAIHMYEVNHGIKQISWLAHSPQNMDLIRSWKRLSECIRQPRSSISF